MADELSDDFWTWYGTDEYALVLQICELIKALELLHSSAEVQSGQMPDCPACEAWVQMILPVNGFLQRFPERISTPLKEQLCSILCLANGLSKEAFHCDDPRIFHSQEWGGLRLAASEALRLIGWPKLQPHIDGVMLDCRKALYPHAYRSDA